MTKAKHKETEKQINRDFLQGVITLMFFRKY